MHAVPANEGQGGGIVISDEFVERI